MKPGSTTPTKLRGPSQGSDASSQISSTSTKHQLVPASISLPPSSLPASSPPCRQPALAASQAQSLETNPSDGGGNAPFFRSRATTPTKNRHTVGEAPDLGVQDGCDGLHEAAEAFGKAKRQQAQAQQPQQPSTQPPQQQQQQQQHSVADALSSSYSTPPRVPFSALPASIPPSSSSAPAATHLSALLPATPSRFPSFPPHASELSPPSPLDNPYADVTLTLPPCSSLSAVVRPSTFPPSGSSSSSPPPSGYLLVLSSASLQGAAGLLAGDEVRAINGLDLDCLDPAAAADALLQGCRAGLVLVVRRRQPGRQKWEGVFDEEGRGRSEDSRGETALQFFNMTFKSGERLGIKVLPANTSESGGSATSDEIYEAADNVLPCGGLQVLAVTRLPEIPLQVGDVIIQVDDIPLPPLSFDSAVSHLLSSGPDITRKRRLIFQRPASAPSPSPVPAENVQSPALSYFGSPSMSFPRPPPPTPFSQLPFDVNTTDPEHFEQYYEGSSVDNKPNANRNSRQQAAHDSQQLLETLAIQLGALGMGVGDVCRELGEVRRDVKSIQARLAAGDSKAADASRAGDSAGPENEGGESRPRAWPEYSAASTSPLPKGLEDPKVFDERMGIVEAFLERRYNPASYRSRYAMDAGDEASKALHAAYPSSLVFGNFEAFESKSDELERKMRDNGIVRNVGSDGMPRPIMGSWTQAKVRTAEKLRGRGATGYHDVARRFLSAASEKKLNHF